VQRVVRRIAAKRKAPSRRNPAKPHSADKAAAAIRRAAQRYGKQAIEKLWDIASNAESDGARIAACKEILDRGYGKESRVPAADSGEAMIRRIERIIVDPKN
jgi:hypothetical protein